jgi:hypothetical protein
VEERDAEGNTTMVEAAPQGSAGSGAQLDIASMLGAVMQSPALRQMAEDPEMQRLSGRLVGAERCASLSDLTTPTLIVYSAQ